jgi:phage terminase small subunit
MDSSKPLKNIRHEKFVQLYLGEANGNASSAYVAAGYRPKSPEVTNAVASRLLSSAKVRDRIDHLREAAAKKAQFTRVEYLETLVAKVKGSPREDIQLRALEMLSKALGYNEPDKLEVAHQFPDFIQSPERYVAIAAGS